MNEMSVFKETSLESVFKYKCCRCGFCCMQSTCIVAIKKYGIRTSNLFPLMKYDEESREATCSVSKDVEIGIGGIV